MGHALEETGIAAQETVAGGTGFGRAGRAGIDGLAGGHRLPVAGGFVRRADHRHVGGAVIFHLARGGDGETVQPIWREYLPARFANCLLDSDRHEHYFRCFLVFCGPGVAGVGATLVHCADEEHALTSLSG